MKNAMDKISTVTYLEDLTEDIACTKLILLSLKPAEKAQQSQTKPVCKMERPVSALLQGKLSSLQKF